MFELLEPIVEIFGDLIIRAIGEHIPGEAALSNVDVELPPPRFFAGAARFPSSIRCFQIRNPQRPLQQQAITYYERDAEMDDPEFAELTRYGNSTRVFSPESFLPRPKSRGSV
jgi:hypothetical protein